VKWITPRRGRRKLSEPFLVSQLILFESIADGVKETPAKQELSDSELLQRSKKGDEEAFLMLYRRHQGSVFRFALHMSGRQETAEEVTQDVFLALLSGKDLYDPDRGSMQGYLIGAARNQVRRSLAQMRSLDVEVTPRFSNSANELLDGLSKEQEIGSLRMAILSLPVSYREVVVLCELEDMSYAQAAQQLGCAIGTVRSRLHRARTILEAKLRKGERCRA